MPVVIAMNARKRRIAGRIFMGCGDCRSFIRAREYPCQQECSVKRAFLISLHSMVMVPSREHEIQAQRHRSKTPTASTKPGSDTGSVGREVPASRFRHHTGNNGENRERSQSRLRSRDSLHRKSAGSVHRITFSTKTTLHCPEASKPQRNHQNEGRQVGSQQFSRLPGIFARQLPVNRVLVAHLHHETSLPAFLPRRFDDIHDGTGHVQLRIWR